MISKNDAQPNRLQNYVKMQFCFRFGNSLVREIQYGFCIASLWANRLEISMIFSSINKLHPNQA